MRSDRGQKRKNCPKIHEGKKCRREIWIGNKPQAQRRFYGTLQVNRSRPLLKETKKLRRPKKGCFRSRDDVHAIFICSLLYSQYGKERQDKKFILYHTEKKTLAKDNTTYVRYKRPLAKKQI